MKKKDIFALAMIFIGLGILMLYGTLRMKLAIGMAFIIILFFLIEREIKVFDRKKERVKSILVGILILMGMIPVGYKGIEKSHISFQAIDADRGKLYEWVRQNTNLGAIFVIPPSWKDFRLIAKRAVVVAGPARCTRC